MNAVWALDFMRDTLYSGRIFRTLNVIDEANRGALGIDVAVRIPAARVITFLNQMIDLRGRPQAIRFNNGSELTNPLLQFCLIAGGSLQIAYRARRICRF